MKTIEVTENSRTMPYGSWGTFQTTLDHFAAVGIPNVIDRNTLPASLSGAAKYETLGAYKFFALIGNDNRPNVDLLQRLVDSATRTDAMVELLKKHYNGLFQLPLSTAGPGEINKWFAENATSSTAQRAKAFFIRAAKASAVQMHSLVAKGTRGSSGSIKRRPKKKSQKETLIDDDERPEATDDSHDITDKLLAKFPDFDPTWDAAVQQKWFDGFAKLQDQLNK